MQKRKIKKILVITLSAIVLLIALGFAGFFIFRNTILEKAISKASHKFEQQYNSEFKVQQAQFKGFSGITLQGITLVPQNGDTLLNIQSLNTSVNLPQALLGKIQLGKLYMQDGYISLVRNKNGKNFNAFIHAAKSKKQQKIEPNTKSYAERAHRLIKRAFNLIPTDIALKNLSLKLNDMERKVTIDLEELNLSDKQLTSSFLVKEDDKQQNWKVKGMADPRHEAADLDFYNNDSTHIEIPYLKKRLNLTTAFKKLHLNLQEADMKGDEFYIKGYASINDLLINHPKIASKDVVLDSARFEYSIIAGEKFIALDSASVAQFNKVTFTPFAKFSTEQDTIYQLKAHIPEMQAQDFISSLPKGLFSHFEGMQAEGSFSYSLDFAYNKNKPNDLVFESDLNKKGLKITKYGAADLNKLNGTFTYRAIENGVRQRPIIVGEENPNFTPLEHISPYIQKAVLTSEDPSFFQHNGFIAEAFRQSIIKNIKTKKFARGASTISMQLVKNVFLTREKTLSRKLEEILLVYILENNRIVSKKRMLEVYFNIIEWGPDVYGIGEAAQYYFQKPPVILSLDESLFLASIVPRPKKFMWQFDKSGNMKPHAHQHNNFIMGLMLRRELITAQDTINQDGKAELYGAARARLNIVQTDTIAQKRQDSLEIDRTIYDLYNKAY